MALEKIKNNPLRRLLIVTTVPFLLFIILIFILLKALVDFYKDTKSDFEQIIERIKGSWSAK